MSLKYLVNGGEGVDGAGESNQDVVLKQRFHP